jgi:hypothetical protein
MRAAHHAPLAACRSLGRGDADSGQGGGRLLADQLHQGGHAGHAFRALHEQVHLRLGVVAVLPVQIVQLFVHRLARRLGCRCHFGHQHAGQRTVLVAGVLAHQIAVGFLQSQDESIRADVVHRPADPLESHQQIADRADAIRIPDAADHLRSHQRLDQIMIGGQAAGMFQHEIDQESAQLIARECGPRSIGGQRQGGGTTHPVGVGVGGQDQISPNLLGSVDDRFEDLGVLGIRDVTGHVRELAVGLAMQLEDLDVRKPVRPQNRTHRRRADAMQRRVDDFQVPGTRAALRDHGLDKRCVALFGAEHNAAVGNSRLKIDSPDLLDVHHTVDHRLVMGRQDLAASRPVDFDSIVAGRIVTGRHHDAARALLVPHEERQFGRAAVIVQEVHAEARRHHDAGAQFGKMTRIDRVS